MTTRIAVVDDDDRFRKEIVKAIETECKKHRFDIVIDEFFNGRRLMGMLDDKKTFDVYFLDIQMSYMTGVQLAESIRRVDEYAVIVFLSAYEEYAIQGYSYQVFDYILKQNWRERLSEVIKRVQKKTEERKMKMYFIENEIRWEAVYFKDLLYLEKQGKSVIFHCMNDRIYRERNTLKQVYSQFPQETFIYVNRGQIVNLKYVVYMDRDIIKLRDGSILDLSRYMLDDIREKMLNLGRTL